ncbi:MFS general substrate transporter [Pseudovirgaria hyperparasitica]|uniref:MFS general substrate transporter n=1 Tax=Pseudovirgaria hyperparasitica TaxID=470096 RepID=A0A6A6VTA0_9PEZI|nr:MFS general substrate transporter [Pseudovirgaria hyperparasitica]KAF2753109.1 MFS general substrate transporter [Pseudovirgaria hyperparasitica]
MPGPLGAAEFPTEQEHKARQLSIGGEKNINLSETHQGVSLDSDVEALEKEDVQYGVKAVEATAIVWSRNALIGAYAAIFLVFFVNSFLQQTSYTFTLYVTSSFALHELTATTAVMSQIIGGVVRLPLAKLIDIVGRTEGYLAALTCATIGLIMMAACNGVELYAAAQVFYWVGYNCMGYTLDVFIADTSSLKSRGLMFAFTTAPYIATTFAGPALGQEYLDHSTWRWGYGSFAIITPIICAPVALIFWINKRKAKKAGLLTKVPSGRTWFQSVKFYLIEFDFIGVLLICAGFVMFLLPFNLAAGSASKWNSPDIIALLVVGIVCLIGFVLYEKFVAPKPFIPFELLLDRTVLGACILAATLFVSFYCWDGYLLSYLQVVWNLKPKSAGYIYNTYNLSSCAWGIIAGLLIRQAGYIKRFAAAAMPLMFLGAGLLIHFRQPDQSVGYVIMCQVLIGVAGGTLVICEEIAVLASGAHENVATLLALIGMFSSIGGAIGLSVSAAIWTNIVPGEIAARLPADSAVTAAELYASAITVLTYAPGTPERNAVIGAYAVAQRWMAIASTCILVIGVGAIAVWRDIDVRKFKQVKGRVV